MVSGKRTPFVYFTSPSTQVEDFSPINHEDANYYGHFVGFPIIKTTAVRGGSTLFYFEILGDIFGEFSAFLCIQVELSQAWECQSFLLSLNLLSSVKDTRPNSPLHLRTQKMIVICYHLVLRLWPYLPGGPLSLLQHWKWGKPSVDLMPNRCVLPQRSTSSRVSREEVSAFLL